MDNSKINDKTLITSSHTDNNINRISNDSELLADLFDIQDTPKEGKCSTKHRETLTKKSKKKGKK